MRLANSYYEFGTNFGASKWRKYPEKTKEYRKISLKGRKNTDAHDISIICNVYEALWHGDRVSGWAATKRNRMERIPLWQRRRWAAQNPENFVLSNIIEIDACFEHYVRTYFVTYFNHIQMPSNMVRLLMLEKCDGTIWISSFQWGGIGPDNQLRRVKIDEIYISIPLNGCDKCYTIWGHDSPWMAGEILTTLNKIAWDESVSLERTDHFCNGLFFTETKYGKWCS